MIRLRPSGADEVLIKRVQDWYEPGPGVFIQSLTASFSPAMLFTGSTTGVWYDPSDFTTLYQDAAGTTPVTAVEQPVGLMLDKSGRGNHAVNNSGNSANFPVLSARYNLLTKTEQFDDGVWTKNNLLNFGAGSVANTTATLDPVGGNSADLIVPNTTSTTNHGVAQNFAFSSGTQYKFVCHAKPAGYSFVKFFARNTAFGTNVSVSFDLVGVSYTVMTGSATCTITATTNGFLRMEVVATASASATTDFQWVAMNATGDVAYSGNGTSGVYIWGADLRVANDALNQPAYQRVNTSSDYDTVGFKQGEVFDGINDYLTASAGGGSTTSFFWCSAIRAGKVGAVQTLFSDAGTNTGYRVRINASNQLELSAGNGTAYSTVSTTATLSIGQRAVLTAWHDGTNLNVQINNGTVHQVAFSTATAGTAQFTIGKNNNAASNFFAGWLYEKVYTKDSVPSSAQIADTKAYVANIAGITL